MFCCKEKQLLIIITIVYTLSSMKKFVYILLFTVLSSTAQNSTCDVVEQCIYTLTLESANGSGWNGNTMTIFQNNEAIKTIGLNFTNGTSLTDNVFLCDATSFNLVWNEGGSQSENVKIKMISPFNQTIFIKNYGDGEQNSTLFSATANCTTDCCFFYPTNLNFISSTETTAQLSWATTYYPPQYDIFLTTDLAITANLSDPFITVNNNPAEITDLIPCTNYKYYVRYRCSPVEFSLWSVESVIFSTQCTMNLNQNEFQNLQISPNPVIDDLFISNNKLITEIEVFSIQGKKIMTIKTNFHSGTINLNALQKGLYLLKLKGINESKTIKILKN